MIDRTAMRRITFLVCLLAAAIATPAAFGAGNGASFAARPVHFDKGVPASHSYFVVQAAPGATVTNAVRISNVGNEPGTLLLYPVDATTGATSGAVYDGRNHSRKDVGSWVQLASSRISLAPHSSTLVPFTLHVPADAAPGDHLGGIVAENLQLTNPTQNGDLHVRIRHLTVVAVEVQIPGAASARLTLEGVRPGGGHGYQYVYVKLANTGHLMIKPHGWFTVRNAQGDVIGSVHLNLDLILPGTSIELPVLLHDRVLSPGDYSTSLQLSYAAVPTGYRKVPGPLQHLNATAPLHVSQAQQKQVYEGAPPAKAPAASKSLPSYLWVGAGTLLIVLAAVVLLGVRRWAAEQL